MENTKTLDKNTFYKSTIVDGIETPYPPDAPAFCTRQSVKEVEETSKELTRKELEKLQKKKNPSFVTKPVTCVPSVEFNPDMHRIMCKYADKQQQLCSQICEINSRLQRKQDLIIELKEKHQKELTQLQDELSHLTEVNEANEDEINELNESLEYEKDSLAKLQRTHEQYVDNQSLWIFLYIILYTFCLFFANKRYDFQIIQNYDIFDQMIGDAFYYCLNKLM